MGRAEAMAADGATARTTSEGAHCRQQGKRDGEASHVQLRWPDGLVTYEYSSRRELAARRIEATTEMTGTLDFDLSLALCDHNLGLVFGALRAVFGPAHDIVDDYKSSSSYFLVVRIARRSRQRAEAPTRFLLELCDYKGALHATLCEPRSGPGRYLVRSADDVLPRALRQHVVLWLLGYLEGWAEKVPLPDFERAYPRGCTPEAGGAGAERGCYRYGVRAGVPFDDAHPARSLDDILDPRLDAAVEEIVQLLASSACGVKRSRSC